MRGMKLSGCGGATFWEQASTIKYQVLIVPQLIETARTGLPEGCFECAEAVKISPIPKYDYVFANNVFHYFSHEYASEVMELMCQKSKKYRDFRCA